MSDKRPDVVVILVDDMGWSDLGCYGGEIDTPNLDALAGGGVRYTQFYNCARCCPTRAALLTGLYPHRAGIGHMTAQTSDTLRQSRLLGRPHYRGYLSDNTATIAEALGPAGYQTFMAGKWHVGSYRPNWPTDRGFDRYAGMLSGACNYWEPGAGAGLLEDDEPVTDLPPDFYTTDWFSDRATQFVAEADPDRPYFLYLGYNAPHWPLHAWPEDIARYRGSYLVGWDEIRRRRLARQKELGLFPERPATVAARPGVPALGRDRPHPRRPGAHLHGRRVGSAHGGVRGNDRPHGSGHRPAAGTRSAAPATSTTR